MATKSAERAAAQQELIAKLAVEPAKPGAREKVDSVALTLRLPRTLMAQYAAKAGRMTARLGKTVTVQATLLEELMGGPRNNG